MRWFDGITDALDMNLGNFGRWWGTGKSDMLHFMGSWRVGHYLKTEQTARNLQRYSSLWRRRWQPTPVFLPGEFHGQKSLVGYSPRGCKDLDPNEWLTLSDDQCQFAPLFMSLTHSHGRQQIQPQPSPGNEQGFLSNPICREWNTTKGWRKKPPREPPSEETKLKEQQKRF